MTEAVESVCVLCGALGGGERGVEDVKRGDGQLALNLRREEEAAPECLTENKYFTVLESTLIFLKILNGAPNFKFK